MECYEGATMIKSFRGVIADGGQDTIVLHTSDGSTGYRIKKFQCIGTAPGIGGGLEGITKIYKVPQVGGGLPGVTGTVDFSDNTLVGVNYYSDQDSPAYTAQQQIIFDNEVFNQDLYITFSDVDGSNSLNYYIELEQFTLDMNQNTVATLKDIRNRTESN